MKKACIYTILLTCANLPSTVFAYGEGEDIPYGARALHLLTNEVRTDFYKSIEGCSKDNCKEVEACKDNYDSKTGECKEGTNCYISMQHPLYWSDTLARSADFHNKMNKSYSNCGGHNSPCMLSDTIGADYPEKCDGSPSCACKDGANAKLDCNYKLPDGSALNSSKRIKLFINHKTPSTGEICATSSASFPNTFQPFDLLHHWLFEPGDVTKCEFTSANGHRYHFGSSKNPHTSSDGDLRHHSVGIGYRIMEQSPDTYWGVEDFSRLMPDKIAEFTIGSHPSITNVYMSALSAGSHYSTSATNGELWFKTHYYADTPAKKVVMSLDGQCYSLKNTRGNNKNGVYGTSSLHPDGECIPYFYEVVDTNGKKDRFPTTGSLLYNCSKSWQKSASKSCLNELNCKDTEHEYNGSCEKDSMENCGVHGYACTDVKFWGTGSCTNGQCIIKTCSPDSHIKNEIVKKGIYHTACVANTVSACGEEGLKCSEKVTNWKGGVCTEGKCFATSCQPNFHPENGACVANTAGLSCTKTQHEFNKACKDDDLNNCGAEGYKCANRVAGWASGQCTNRKCIPESCKDGYKFDAEKKTCTLVVKCSGNQHIYNNACENNSITNCGSHGYVCKDKVTDWKSGSCSDGKCVISECVNGKFLKDGKCVISSGSNDPNNIKHCGADGVDCTQTNGWVSGQCSNGKCVVSACVSGKHVENNTCKPNTVDCAENQHEYEGACEDDDSANCGSHDYKCSDIINGWKAGTCESRKCVTSECADNYELIDGRCIGEDEDETHSSAPIDSCSAITHTRPTHLHVWLLALTGLVLFRKRRKTSNVRQPLIKARH